MEYNRLNLVHQLGDEIILGCDMFDADDIWDILHNETVEELKKLADDVRKYVGEQYKEGTAYTAEFLEKQIEYWIFQYRWRYGKIVNGVIEGNIRSQEIEPYEIYASSYNLDSKEYKIGDKIHMLIFK